MSSALEETLVRGCNMKMLEQVINESVLVRSPCDERNVSEQKIGVETLTAGRRAACKHSAAGSLSARDRNRVGDCRWTGLAQQIVTHAPNLSAELGNTVPDDQNTVVRWATYQPFESPIDTVKPACTRGRAISRGQPASWRPQTSQSGNAANAAAAARTTSSTVNRICQGKSNDRELRSPLFLRRAVLRRRDFTNT